MKKPIFAICDPEPEYARRFMEYLRQKGSFSFEPVAFTDPEALRDMAEKTPPDLLLIAEEAADAAAEILPAGKVCRLTESREKSREQQDTVYKYQSADCVLREVMDCYHAERLAAAEIIPRTEECRIIGVCSPSEESLRTRFALAAGLAAAQHCQTLYLNLDTCSGLGAFFPAREAQTLSDLLYFRKDGTAGLTAKLAGMTQSFRQMDFVAPCEEDGDLDEISGKEWTRFLADLMQGSRYRILVLDIGTRLPAFRQILDACRQVYVPTSGDILSGQKAAQLLRYLRTGLPQDHGPAYRQVVVTEAGTAGGISTGTEPAGRTGSGAFPAAAIGQGAGPSGPDALLTYETERLARQVLAEDLPEIFSGSA